MFCSSCGREVAGGLSYCNQCGARLSGIGDPRALPASSFNMMLGAVVGLPFLGLAMLFGVIAALKNGMGFKDDFIFAITFLTFLLFAIAEIACVIMLLTRSKAPRPVIRQDDALSTGRLPQSPAHALGGPTFEPTPVGSVTDHTTRTLDPALRKEQ